LSLIIRKRGEYKMQLFKINKYLTAVCTSESTRYGFRHLATLLICGCERATAKVCYYNRTWERYQFETVLEGLLAKATPRLTEKEIKAFKRGLKKWS
jgi:hypothetical protein